MVVVVLVHVVAGVVISGVEEEVLPEVAVETSEEVVVEDVASLQEVSNIRELKGKQI